VAKSPRCPTFRSVVNALAVIKRLTFGFQCASVMRASLLKLRNPCPMRLTFLIKRLIASVGPLKIPPVVK
jgi:hypothetical protein